MMDNYSRTQELLSHATNSAGASNKQYEKTMESLEAKLNQLKNAWDTFTMDIAKSELIKSVVDLLTNLLTVVNNLTGAFGSFSGVAKLVVAFAGFKLIQPIIVGLTADVVNFAKTLEGTGEARKGFENGLKEGFANLRKTLFDKETWFYEGEKAGVAAKQGVEQGLNEAQTVNAAEAAQESLSTTELAEGLDQVNKEIKITKVNTEKYNTILKQINKNGKASRTQLSKLAECYEINGKQVDFLNAKEKDRVEELLKENSYEEAIIQVLAERTQNIQNSNQALTESVTVEQAATDANKEKIITAEAGAITTQKDTIETEENTDEQLKNNQVKSLGILTQLKLNAALLFGGKAQKTNAVATLKANDAYTGLSKALGESVQGIGWYAVAVAAAVVAFKAITDFYFLEEKILKKEKLERLENVKAIYEETDAIKEQQNTYKEALNSYDETIESKRAYKDATLELAEALGVEIKASDLLAGNTEKINNQLQEATKLKYQQSKKMAEQAKKDAEDLIADAKWNMEYHGALHGTALSTLSDLSLSLYGKQSYSEYEQQLKDSQEALDEANEKLKDYNFKMAFVQSQIDTGITTNAETFEQYKEFRSKLEENLIQFGLNEKEIQQLLNSELSNNETAFEVTLLAEREFIKRLNDLGINIDASELEEFLKQVREDKGAISLANISLVNIDDIDKLKEVYKITKEIDNRIESLKIGEKTASVIEQLASGEAFDSLDEGLVRSFNNELLETEGVYDNLITAQQEWNNLISTGSSEAGKLKYLLKLQEKILDKRQKEKVQLKSEREDRRKELEDTERKLQLLYTNTDLAAIPSSIAFDKSGLKSYLGKDTSPLGITKNNFKFLKDAEQLLSKNLNENTKKIIDNNTEQLIGTIGSTLIDIRDQGQQLVNNPIVKGSGLAVGSLGFGPIGAAVGLAATAYGTSGLSAGLNSLGDIANTEGFKTAVATNINELLNINFQNLDSEKAKSYLERTRELNAALDDTKSKTYEIVNEFSGKLTGQLQNYLPLLTSALEEQIKYLEAIENFNANFDTLDLETKYDALEIRELVVQAAELQQATFTSTNLKSINDLMLKAGSGEDIGELNDGIKNFLDLLPAFSGGFESALEEYTYSISYRSSQEIKDFFEKVSNAGIEKIGEITQKAYADDKQSLLLAKDFISTIQEDWGGNSDLAPQLGLENTADLDKIMSTIVNLSEEEYENLLNSNTAYENLIKNAKKYVEAQEKAATLSAKVAGTSYGLKSSAEYVKAINSNIDTLSSSILDLSELLSKIGEDFTISAEDAKKFAEVFPEILNNATIASDGIIHLNEAEVQSFINGKKEELDKDATTIEGQIDNAIAVVEAKKAINQQEKKDFEDKINSINSNDRDSKKVLLKSADLLFEHIRNSGAQEVVDNNQNLRLQSQDWGNFISDVTEMNKSFYSNLASLKLLSEKGIDVNTLSFDKITTDSTGRIYYYNNKQITDKNGGNAVYNAISNILRSNKTSFKLSGTTLEDVLGNSDKIDDLKDEEIDKLFDELVEQGRKILEDNDVSYQNILNILTAAKIKLKSSKGTVSSLKLGSGTETEKDKFENTLDKLYNLLQQLETLEYQYNELLKRRNITGKEIYENLKAQIGNLQEQQKLQKQIVTGRQNEINQIFSNTAGLSNYASYNKETGEIQVNQTAINGIVDKEYGDKILAAISKIETAEKSRKDALNSLSEINDKITEIKEQGISKYIELENRTLEALKQSRQSVIDNLSEINSTINTANSRLMETIKDNINKIRQDRQNEKSEKELSNLQGQLAAMASRTDIDTNTSKEYLDLQKNLQEKTESYQDTMIDQKLASIENDNKKAQEQRENQIEILSRNLETDEKTGVLMAEVQKLITEGMDGQGRLLKTSDFISILKQKDSFDGLSAISKMQWLEELEKLVAEGYAGIGVKNQLENYGAKAGTKLTFSDGSGSVLNGTIAENGNVNVNKNGKTYTYKEVFRNEAGNYETFETYGESSQTSSTVSKQSSLGLSEKDYYGVALATISGAYGWGTGDERVRKYKEKGFDPQKVQSLINTLIYDNQALNGKYFGIKELSEFDYKKYLSGGLADYTGFAWLDGTKSNPEAVLNAAQTKAFINLIDNQKKIMENGSTTNIGGQTNVEVNVSVGQISSDYDVDSMVRRVKEDILEICNYRNDNTLNYLR